MIRIVGPVVAVSLVVFATAFTGAQPSPHTSQVMVGITPTPSPTHSTIGSLVDKAINFCSEQAQSGASSGVKSAFDSAITGPTIDGLTAGGADAATIAETQAALDATKNGLASAAEGWVGGILNGENLFGSLERSLNQGFSKPTSQPSPTASKSDVDLGVPKPGTKQSLSDIVANGFDPGKIELEWKALSGKCDLDNGSTLNWALEFKASGFLGEDYLPTTPSDWKAGIKASYRTGSGVQFDVGGSYSSSGGDGSWGVTAGFGATF